MVHLKKPGWLRSQEIASIHDLGLENDIAVNPNYPRAAELLQNLGEQLFGASSEGPVEVTGV